MIEQDDLDTLVQSLEAFFDDVHDEVTVIPDDFRGLRLRIVSSRFRLMDKSARREAVLDIVDDEEIAALALLSPEEVDGPDDVRIERDSEDLPLWADTLAEGSASPTLQVHLPSSRQEQLTPPIVATFYSLRGGVGRSTALAHAAYNLAAQGLAVLCVDMDLEAPGLAALFGVEAEAVERPGVVDILGSIDINGEVPTGFTDSFIRVPTADANSRLEVLHAGTISPSYARDLGLIDPEAWYREDFNPLRVLVDAIRELDVAVRPDVILVDSRTGLSPIAAPLLFDIADLAIIAFLPHPQARVGTSLLTRALLSARSSRATADGVRLTPEPRFVVSPVAPSEENFARAQQRALNWISEWLAPARDNEGNKPFDDLEEIIHVVGYNEEIASSDTARGASLHGAYEPIAQWIAGFVETAEVAGPGEASNEIIPSKLEVLESLGFTGQTADGQSAEDIRDIFVSTEAVAKALRSDTRLVIGRKGTGKTLLFRQIHFNERIKSVAVTMPAGEDPGPLGISAAQYTNLDKILIEHGLPWDVAWRALILLALLRDGHISRPGSLPELKAEQLSSTYRGQALLADVRSLLAIPDADVVIADWLGEVDESLDAPIYALFDGLDTGFNTDRGLRNRAVTGLLLLLNGEARAFKRLHFKVFLREDIFRSVDIPNRTHLRSEASVLAWNDQYDYLRLVIRQVWRSGEFRTYVEAALVQDDAGLAPERAFNFNTDIEYWPDDIVLAVWRVLVGERMSGGKTAFTQNWVWARLADVNEDHAPRHLIGLFEHAVEKERTLEQGAPYSRALIRPRALTEALDSVSEGALDALEEEFPELEEILQELREIGRTPFDEELSGEVELAREVGLVSRFTDGRYRVPDIYRRPLGMNRQGQQ
ncbi:P-loop ATPase, Sll1717 family [Curtobacterium sp. NPDC089991]|uniref:P-loop ATPase, Sll1717 family n=1 Tax=Curtobacterium sp. NPDC089991 TaxID=3363969 RepID=UPI00380169E7